MCTVIEYRFMRQHFILYPEIPSIRLWSLVEWCLEEQITSRLPDLILLLIQYGKRLHILNLNSLQIARSIQDMQIDS